MLMISQMGLQSSFQTGSVWEGMSGHHTVGEAGIEWLREMVSALWWSFSFLFASHFFEFREIFVLGTDMITEKAMFNIINLTKMLSLEDNFVNVNV